MFGCVVCVVPLVMVCDVFSDGVCGIVSDGRDGVCGGEGISKVK